MSGKNYSQQEINNKFTSFANQMMFLRVINSGKSNMSDVQVELVAKAFKDAYEIMKIAVKHQNCGLFYRVFRMAHELVPSVEMMKVMKYPEMYNKMQNTNMEFNNQVAALLRNNASFCATIRRGSR